MESISFLKEKLEGLYSSNPHIEIRYEYRAYLNTHIIDVRPSEFFEGNLDYVDFQIGLEKEFEDTFIDEEILFITENGLITVSNPIIELGMLHEECDYEIVAPVKVEYSNSYKEYDYCVETKIRPDFEIPIPPSILKSWFKKPVKNKKTLSESQGFFV